MACFHLFRRLSLLTLVLVPSLGVAADPAPATKAPTSAPAATNAAAAQTPAPPDPNTGIPSATSTKTGDVITELDVKDPTQLTDADYQKIAQMKGLKKLSFGHGFPESGLKAIAGLPALEDFTTNGADLSDETIPLFATFKNLQTLTFFHPGKRINWTTLSSLASLPNLKSFSVGGSTLFADGAMPQVAQLSHLENFRTWHTGVSIEGVKALPALKNLKSITLGQRLAYTPPTTLSDDAVAVLAGMPSLENINLDEARLSLPALEKLKQLPNLKTLNMMNIDIPEADIATLKQEMPKVNVHWAAPTNMKRIDALFGASSPSGAPATGSAKPSAGNAAK